MSRSAPQAPRPGAAADPAENAIAVVSAYGAFRVLLVVLAVWTGFAGFSLLTQSVGALTFGANDSATERVLGGYMLLTVPVYVLLAWRRDEYRLLIWIPYAAQIAVIVPMGWAILSGDRDADDGALMLVIAVIFLVLLVYVWWDSHPLGFFAPEDESIDDEYEDDEMMEEDEDVAGEAVDDRGQRRRYRRS
jgi:hypothetical protein